MVAALLLVGCGSDSGSGSSASAAKDSSPSSSPSSDEPRIDGDYDLGEGFVVHFEPTCDEGPCDVKMSYDYSDQTGSKGSGLLKFDGHFYRGIVHNISGCLINNKYVPGTTVGTMHYQLVAQSPQGEDPAPQISGQRRGVYKLTKAGQGHAGCAPGPDMKGVTGTLQ